MVSGTGMGDCGNRLPAIGDNFVSVNGRLLECEWTEDGDKSFCNVSASMWLTKFDLPHLTKSLRLFEMALESRRLNPPNLDLLSFEI